MSIRYIQTLVTQLTGMEQQCEWHPELQTFLNRAQFFIRSSQIVGRIQEVASALPTKEREVVERSLEHLLSFNREETYPARPVERGQPIDGRRDIGVGKALQELKRRVNRLAEERSPSKSYHELLRNRIRAMRQDGDYRARCIPKEILEKFVSTERLDSLLAALCNAIKRAESYKAGGAEREAAYFELDFSLAVKTLSAFFKHPSEVSFPYFEGFVNVEKRTGTYPQAYFYYDPAKPRIQCMRFECVEDLYEGVVTYFEGKFPCLPQVLWLKYSSEYPTASREELKRLIDQVLASQQREAKKGDA